MDLCVMTRKVCSSSASEIGVNKMLFQKENLDLYFDIYR